LLFGAIALPSPLLRDSPIPQALDATFEILSFHPPRLVSSLPPPSMPVVNRDFLGGAVLRTRYPSPYTEAQHF
jgi:hypothetical protein